MTFHYNSFVLNIFQIIKENFKKGSALKNDLDIYRSVLECKKLSKEFAQRLVRENGDNPDAWIRKAWRLALGRDPNQLEKLEAMNLLKSMHVSKQNGNG